MKEWNGKEWTVEEWREKKEGQGGTGMEWK